MTTPPADGPAPRAPAASADAAPAPAVQHEESSQINAIPDLPIATALRQAWADGMPGSRVRADLLAGAVVGVVALPLSMALAIAIGAPPQHGLYTAIVAGLIAAIAGGSSHQVTGPTAAFVVILAPIVSKYGLSGLMTAGFMAGLILIFLGWARLGGLMRYVPAPVTTGFTAGIASVIATLQIKDLFGLQVTRMPEHYHEKVLKLWDVRATVSLRETGVAAFTLLLLLVLPKLIRRVPAPLLAISAAAGAVWACKLIDPQFEVATIGSRFSTVVDGITYAGIPPVLPRPAMPWGEHGLSFTTVQELLPSALAIALLGAIESLLSAVIADGMTGQRHDPDAELVGQGLANVVAPLFGGIAATGALARTATNIRAGATSPLAAAFHSVIVLLAILALAPLVAFVPMASLAALLVLVAWNMSDFKHVVAIFRIAPKSDKSVLVVCFLLTVVFDMVVAISIGFMLAAVLFMRRMAVLTDAKWLNREAAAQARATLPEGASLYQIQGPLFFGAVYRAMGALHATSSDRFKVLLLDLSQVPVIDATGYAALEEVVERLGERNRGVVLVAPLPQPHKIWERARIAERYSHVFIGDDLPNAVELAKAYMARRAVTGAHPVQSKPA